MASEPYYQDGSLEIDRCFTCGKPLDEQQIAFPVGGSARPLRFCSENCVPWAVRTYTSVWFYEPDYTGPFWCRTREEALALAAQDDGPFGIYSQRRTVAEFCLAPEHPDA